MNLTATLTSQEWDVIGKVLIQRPWAEVNDIITKLNTQFAQQNQQPAAPAPSTEASNG